MVLFKTLSGTIPANSNEITFTDSIINSNTIVEAYYNNNDIYTVETWQDGTTIGIVVNDHTVPVGIKVTLNNVSSFEPYDDTDLVNQINGLSDDVSGLDGRLDTAEDDIDSLETRMGSAEDDIDALESGKQNVLTAGDNITIEGNVISASGGSIDYSTNERVVGTWVDGKPLYEKTFLLVPTSLSNTIDVSSLNINKLIKREGSVTRNVNASTVVQQKNIEYRTETPSNNNYGFLCELRDSNLVFNIDGYLYTEIVEARITILYTKTTD